MKIARMRVSTALVRFFCIKLFLSLIDYIHNNKNIAILQSKVRKNDIFIEN